jgi:hypothetical protein
MGEHERIYIMITLMPEARYVAEQCNDNVTSAPPPPQQCDSWTPAQVTCQKFTQLSSNVVQSSECNQIRTFVSLVKLWIQRKMGRGYWREETPFDCQVEGRETPELWSVQHARADCLAGSPTGAKKKTKKAISRRGIKHSYLGNEDCDLWSVRH